MRKKAKNICVVFVGDGALEEGIFHETMNFWYEHNFSLN
jgi:TPP-dependent pyruvate/acetoin dehydrogenase alpha subunit